MSKKSLIIILGLIAAVSAGVFIWRAQDTRAKAAKMESEILKGLTVEEINLILKSEASNNGGAVAGIAERAETRQIFLKAMREYLGLAAQARREGLTEDPNFQINLNHKRNILLADLYSAKLSKEQGKNYSVSKEEMNAVWTDPENEKQFNTVMDALRTIQIAVARERGDQSAFPKLAGGSLVKARDNWARTKILSDRAKADAGFATQPGVQLRLKIVEAGILSADYLRKNWSQKVKATEQEIAAYLAVHPQYDVKRKLEKAKMLLQKVKAGEDFSKLAAEYSEDRLTKNKGGLYENVEKDTLWAEVETAALALEKGQTADKLIESHIGYHIVRLEDKQTKKEADGSESFKFSVRHILLQKNFEDPANTNPDIPSPFITAEEVAKAEVEKEKRNKFVDDIVRRNEIVLPEDFTVELPEGTTAKPLDNPKSNAETAQK